MLKINKSLDALVQNLSALHLQSRCASYANRESKMLHKLMSGKKRVAFKWVDPHSTKKPAPINEVSKKPSKITARRSIVLNKLFMRHVTELIASGPIGFELCGLRLEITRVTVCQHYHGLNIFWTATGTDDFEYVEQKLASINKRLRHELHQMQLMGNVPHLTFVRDEQVSYFDALDAAINRADYGEDFEPTLKKKQKNDFQVQNEEVLENDETATKSSLLPMRQDVFGLNHAVIMGRIKQSMAKSRQAWKAFEEKQMNPILPTKPFSFNTSFESIRQEHASEKQSTDVLKEFLQKRKLMKKQKRLEQAEFNAQMEENWSNRSNNEEDDDWIEAEEEDDDEVQKFYDEYEPFEK